MRVLELFSGTGSIGKVAKELNWEVISLDLKNADINIDILEWNYKIYPVGHFDIIWASPPCDTFSHLRSSWIGRKLKKHGDTIITKEILEKDMMEEGVVILNKTKEIIKYFNPSYWFMENPQTGRMKEFNYDLPFYDVDYCKYGFDYRKRTRIWTNVKNFIPKKCCNDCDAIIIFKNIDGTHPKKDKDGNKHIIKSSIRTLHISNCGNTEKINAVKNAIKNNTIIKCNKNLTKDYTGATSIDMRYRIPPLLIEELFECILKDI